MRESRLRIVVTGLAGLHPVGGVAWDYLQYVIGLYRLGHDVYYFEDTWSWPYHPLKRSHVATGDYSAQFLNDFFHRYAPELADHWHYLHLHEVGYGLSKAAIANVLRTADLFINVSGANLVPNDLSPNCVKVFVDTDPGYNQIVMSERFAWSENVDRWCNNVTAHDFHFTYAENIHGEDCLIPKTGLDWKTTRMPVVLDLWAKVTTMPAPLGSPWTTVMTWNAFKGPVVYRGVEYFSKGAEFEKLVSLPSHVPYLLSVAVGGKEAPLSQLAEYGWQVQDGPTATVTPEAYHCLIANSRGEISTAKHIYVATRSGWFSCRSACYLAAGRPVVVQDTGFSRVLRVGKGLIGFSTLEEAISGLRQIESDYLAHATTARYLAEEYFDSRQVLAHLIDQALGDG